MKTKKIHNVQLGIFVLAGIVFLVFMLYMMSRNRNLLGSTFTMKAVVSNANGLVPGNNVRFKGIDVGTVKSITVVNDTAIYVAMTIDTKMRPFIKQNAVASIGTDGLMGNKLININSKAGISNPVEEGSVILSLKPVETDEMLRTLNTTNNNIERITENLKQITVKLNNSKSLWNLLSDTAITQDLKMTVSNFKEAGSNTARLTSNAQHMVTRLEEGNGIVSALFTDTIMVNQLNTSLSTIQHASEQTSAMMEDLKKVIENMKQGEGTAGMLLTDSAMKHALEKSILNVEQGTGRFNENMEALKSNFLFRRYFKRQEKQKKQAAEQKY
jgi:phospholipid/cholesterol/gamma-HCH transport system substrate-binding protein